ncbi:hypothetical protein A8709_22690 [Paenibacillus pectinilyticus]|uniref:Uncharacterized protein n=1 Tax=Paenibacillus pectinilyticus TaxID=512399 RepID=A0A1C0ZRK4_9BACL|nr:hypothetical protein A8709_22690 [Paenibacillus pectinilyticus]
MISFNYNEWLDEYNDCLTLFEMFGDEHYLLEATEVLHSLKAVLRRIDHNTKLTQCINNDVCRNYKYILSEDF